MALVRCSARRAHLVEEPVTLLRQDDERGRIHHQQSVALLLPTHNAASSVTQSMTRSPKPLERMFLPVEPVSGSFRRCRRRAVCISLAAEGVSEQTADIPAVR